MKYLFYVNGCGRQILAINTPSHWLPRSNPPLNYTSHVHRKHDVVTLFASRQALKGSKLFIHDKD